MSWQETTLRKGTKIPKICRDMFITDSRGAFYLCEVKNGRVATRQEITKKDADGFIKHQNLIRCRSIFNNCYTYRTEKSAELVSKLLSAVK